MINVTDYLSEVQKRAQGKLAAIQQAIKEAGEDGHDIGLVIEKRTHNCRKIQGIIGLVYVGSFDGRRYPVQPIIDWMEIPSHGLEESALYVFSPKSLAELKDKVKLENYS